MTCLELARESRSRHGAEIQRQHDDGKFSEFQPQVDMVVPPITAVALRKSGRRNHYAIGSSEPWEKPVEIQALRTIFLYDPVNAHRLYDEERARP